MRNGTREVTLRGLHGKVRFRLQRFIEQPTGRAKSYFELSDQFPESYLSRRLQELVVYYSNRLSYQEVEKLLRRTTGAQLLSDQKIQQVVLAKAAAVSRAQQATIKRLAARPLPPVSGQMDLYSTESPEVVLFEDSIRSSSRNRHGGVLPPRLMIPGSRRSSRADGLPPMWRCCSSATAAIVTSVAASMKRGQCSTALKKPFMQPWLRNMARVGSRFRWYHRWCQGHSVASRGRLRWADSDHSRLVPSRQAGP